MKMTLDDLLKEVEPPRPGALAAVRAAVRAELRTGKPIARWPRQLARVSAAVFGLVAATAAVLVAVGQSSLAAIAAHLTTLGLLAAVALAAAIGALRPSAPRGAVLWAAALGAAAVVALRPEGSGHSPEWVCTLSHVLIGLLPLAVVAGQLRNVAPDPKRALLGGLAAGSVGMMLGELACGRGPLHAFSFHLPAWALIATAAALLMRRIRPRSYAP